MKIDTNTLKKQVILHLPYLLFLLVFAKLGEAVRLAPGADASQKLLGLSEGFSLAFQSMWPGAALACDWPCISKARTPRSTGTVWSMAAPAGVHNLKCKGTLHGRTGGYAHE